ncbi:glycoside hydrolase family protein, partial [Clostridium perfringens]
TGTLNIEKIKELVPGEVVPNGFSFTQNAQVIGDELYLRDKYGNRISGRSVSNGDKITVLDIEYEKQLALVQYPAGNLVRQGYVTNNTNIIKYIDSYNWLNGSTSENVFSGPKGSNIIGSVNPHEKATKLFETEGRTCIVYDTSKGKLTKVGFVDFKGLINTESHGENPTGGGSETSGLVSEKLVDFIKTFEGFSAVLYKDQGGVPTIGYGSTHGWIMSRTHVTKEEATRALREELNSVAKEVKRDLDRKGVRLNQQQFDALCSFAYNTGTYALLHQSNLYERICKGVRDSSLKANFEAFCHVNGSVSQGLLNRRRDEFEMFMYGDYRRDH